MNQLPIFLDTGYWLAFVNADDQYHRRARGLAGILRRPLVTTEAVLLELGDALTAPRWRRVVLDLIEQIRTTSTIEVVPLSTGLIDRALQLFAARPGKEWGLTDCISFVVMAERGIREALAADQHFVQAGFRALLRE